MIKEYEVKSALDDAAQRIHEFDPNPITWFNWITYLLDQLENQSMDANPANHDRYRDMLANLRDAIYNRQQTGSW